MNSRFRVCKNDWKSINDIEETEANYFAVLLLMPRSKLREVIYLARLPEWSLVKFCSDYFCVPESAVRYRLRILEEYGI